MTIKDLEFKRRIAHTLSQVTNESGGLVEEEMDPFFELLRTGDFQIQKDICKAFETYSINDIITDIILKSNEYEIICELLKTPDIELQKNLVVFFEGLVVTENYKKIFLESNAIDTLIELSTTSDDIGLVAEIFELIPQIVPENKKICKKVVDSGLLTKIISMIKSFKPSSEFVVEIYEDEDEEEKEEEEEDKEDEDEDKEEEEEEEDNDDYNSDDEHDEDYEENVERASINCFKIFTQLAKDDETKKKIFELEPDVFSIVGNFISTKYDELVLSEAGAVLNELLTDPTLQDKFLQSDTFNTLKKLIKAERINVNSLVECIVTLIKEGNHHKEIIDKGFRLILAKKIVDTYDDDIVNSAAIALTYLIPDLSSAEFDEIITEKIVQTLSSKISEWVSSSIRLSAIKLLVLMLEQDAKKKDFVPKSEVISTLVEQAKYEEVDYDEDLELNKNLKSFSLKLLEILDEEGDCLGELNQE